MGLPSRRAAISCLRRYKRCSNREQRRDRFRCHAAWARHNGPMPKLPPAPWWTVRRAHNRKPATYRCPFCGNRLLALTDHVLIAPEGDTSRRRHAHTECALQARSRGELPLREDWLRSQPARPSLWRRLLSRR
jgi:hypothetical protein